MTDRPSRNGERRFPMLDALRGVAVLAILTLHVGAASGANTSAPYGQITSQLRAGVTLFFVLSGFLLYRPHALALAGLAPAPKLRVYAARRFLRIAPAYWVALTLLAIWPGLDGVFTRDAWVYYGFAQSYRNEWMMKGIGPAWSLSVEVSFYALLPLLAVLLRRACAGRDPAGRVRLQLAAFALLGLASLALRSIAFSHWLPLRNMIFTQFLWFALGMGLAVESVRLEAGGPSTRAVRLVERHPGACWLLAAALYAIPCTLPGFPRAFQLHFTRATFIAEHALFACVAFLLVLPAVFGERAGGLPRRVLASRALRWVGLISYSLFLWHGPLLVAFATRIPQLVPGWPFLSLALVGLPPIFAVSWLSFTWIERPALRRKPGYAPAAGAPVAAPPPRETTAQSSTRR